MLFRLVPCTKNVKQIQQNNAVLAKVQSNVVDDCGNATEVAGKSNKICQGVSDVNWEQLARREEFVPEIEIRCQV